MSILNEWYYQFVSLDFPPLLTALAACCSCALLGNFLVLRKLSLMGDAISHAVLPGIVIAFLYGGTRDSSLVFICASIAALSSAVLIELLYRWGRVETGVAMGVIFSIYFAAGVLLIEQASVRSIDLDADCILHGQLETILWFPPKDIEQFFSLRTLAFLPEEVVSSVVVFCFSVGFVALFFKELKISTFDPLLATALGFSASRMHYLLMLAIAASVVVAFKAIGSILVIAMIICPGATARFFTDVLRIQLLLSVFIAASAVVVGYFMATVFPLVVGYQQSLSASGMMATTLGMLLGAATIFAPRYGVLMRTLRKARLNFQVLSEDILGVLYRFQESHQDCNKSIFSQLFPRSWATPLLLWRLEKGGDILFEGEVVSLTQQGYTKASKLIRSHRLWESFLVDTLGLRSDHVHDEAMNLEHFTNEAVEEQLVKNLDDKSLDPHGKTIPD